MKKILLLLSICFAITVNAQVYKEFESKKLGETRKLKIQLPRNYAANKEKVYPIVIVLDGDYLFEPVAGNVDYFSYWEDMPEAIVVGIMQGDSRYEDCNYDDKNFVPAEKGAAFFEFIGMELMPYIDNEYRTAKFIIGVGHDFTANFLNYYLFKDPVLFNGYINLSPDYAPLMDERLVERIPNIQSKIFYYLATGSNDIPGLQESIVELDKQLAGIKSDNFKYYFDNFDGATHYSVVGRGIPDALESIFSVYRPISKKEYNEVIMKLETPVHQYLTDKYQTIEDLFGITNPIRKDDFLAVVNAAEKKSQWESFKVLAEIAKKEFPESILAPYYLGRYYEETGEPKKAMRIYKAGYDKEPMDPITVDMMLERADKIKEDFGW